MHALVRHATGVSDHRLKMFTRIIVVRTCLQLQSTVLHDGQGRQIKPSATRSGPTHEWHWLRRKSCLVNVLDLYGAGRSRVRSEGFHIIIIGLDGKHRASDGDHGNPARGSGKNFIHKSNPDSNLRLSQCHSSDDTDARYSQGARNRHRALRNWLMSESGGGRW